MTAEIESGLKCFPGVLHGTTPRLSIFGDKPHPPPSPSRAIFSGALPASSASLLTIQRPPFFPSPLALSMGPSGQTSDRLSLLA
ncbi:hypothetical protein VDGD_20090 [Verticillium dahliae]|nr:hypothetical protein VDGD_20090 [Verticillium dahliae]